MATACRRGTFRCSSTCTCRAGCPWMPSSATLSGWATWRTPSPACSAARCCGQSWCSPRTTRGPERDGAELDPATAGAELDAWVRHGIVPGLTWHVLMREPAPAPAPGTTWRPGRLLRFHHDPEGVVRLPRDLLLSAMQPTILAPPPNGSGQE